MATPVVAVQVSNVYYPVPEELGKKLSKLDENGNGLLDAADEKKCDNKCRAEAFLGLFGPQWKNEAQRDYFIDMSEILYYVKAAHSTSFCAEAFFMADDHNLETAMPCCMPLDYSTIMFAENAIRNAAKKYGWVEGSALVSAVKGPKRSWMPMHNFANVSLLHIEDARVVPAIQIPPEQANEFTEKLFAEIFAKWNMVVSLTSDTDNLAKCVFSINYLKAISGGEEEKGGEEKAERAEKKSDKKRDFNGFTLPLLQVGG